MAKLFRRVQLASALEDSTGTQPAGLWAQGNVDIGLLDADFSPDVESFDREFSRTSVTRVKATQGQKAIGFSFGTELVGTTLGTYAAGVPGFGKWLQAAGFRQEATGILDLTGAVYGTGVTGGPMRHGEIVDIAFTGGTSPTDGVATVIHDTHDGDTVIYLWNVTAPVNTSNDSTAMVLTGQSSGCTITVTEASMGDTQWAADFNATGGYSWWPISEPLKELEHGGVTNAATNGDLIEGATSGARAIFVAEDTAPTRMQYLPVRGTFTDSEVLNNLSGTSPYATAASPTNETFVYGGSLAGRLNLDGTYVDMGGARANVTMACEVNRQVRLNFESRGFFGTIADLPLLAADSISAATPPLWQGTDTYFWDNETRDDTEETRAAEIIPCLTGLELSPGNQFGDRRCASAASGLEEVLIQDRQGTANIKTEATFEADVDFLGKLKSGVVMRTRFTVGAAGNGFYVTAPGIQYESAGQENSNGVRVYNMGAKLTGGAINNLNGGTVALSGVGGDNELVLTYLTSG